MTSLTHFQNNITIQNTIKSFGCNYTAISYDFVDNSAPVLQNKQILILTLEATPQAVEGARTPPWCTGGVPPPWGVLLRFHGKHHLRGAAATERLPQTRLSPWRGEKSSAACSSVVVWIWRM
ncbi:hypothetical protein TNCT_708971 [Trichonephila clavata]|uniref:Uncharacterized protein n=1 Tax=Trichonephila clavata TaxID=2740835 RepID=A0A8X6L174_TRICU|nr:hypothetical protein TNCT_708971 [Trichonephila clavata]